MDSIRIEVNNSSFKKKKIQKEIIHDENEKFSSFSSIGDVDISEFSEIDRAIEEIEELDKLR